MAAAGWQSKPNCSGTACEACMTQALAGGLAAGPLAMGQGEEQAPALQWHFSQVFGERSPGEEVQEGERGPLGASRQRGACPAQDQGRRPPRPPPAAGGRVPRRLPLPPLVLATPRRACPPCPAPPAAADIISAVEFDHSGDFLATGDQGGRVVLFERIAASRAVSRRCRSLAHANAWVAAVVLQCSTHMSHSRHLLPAALTRCPLHARPSPCSARATRTCAPSRRCTPTPMSSAT